MDFRVTLIPDNDVALGPSNVSEFKVVVISGFPAVLETKNPEDTVPCLLNVSTADGQHLRVETVTGGQLPLEQACEMTTKAAEFAVQTLETLR